MNPQEYESLFEVEDRHWWFTALRREIAHEVSRLPGDSPKRWLDAGCGTGGLLANLRAPKLGRGIGVEMNARAIALSRARGLDRLARASVMHLPFPDGTFDLAVSIDVLYHRDVDVSAALAEARRCLKPSGILMLQVPAFDFLKGEHDEAVWTNRRFRRGEMEARLKESGLTPRRSFYRNSLLFPAAAAHRLLRRRPAPGRQARSDVAPAPRAVGLIASAVLLAEAGLHAAGLDLPFGLSLFCVAEKAGRGEKR